ncbi:hypothetical protein fugu_006917 [Takifugu bimaculatus]|uniref:Uncharacterized protein n=1 Tax=Takifugu bimaculatus TaxID=433685 RepID=A0A4Z2B3G6_9TELE|nr:hypothetical protein fugu_006917 [Takifugu bimaculatus]
MAAILWKRDKSWFLNLEPGGRRRPPWLPDLIPSCRCDSEFPHVRTLQRHQEPRLDGSLQNARRKCGRRRAGRVVSRGDAGEPLDPSVVFWAPFKAGGLFNGQLFSAHAHKRSSFCHVPPGGTPTALCGSRNSSSSAARLRGHLSMEQKGNVSGTIQQSVNEAS